MGAAYVKATSLFSLFDLPGLLPVPSHIFLSPFLPPAVYLGCFSFSFYLAMLVPK